MKIELKQIHITNFKGIKDLIVNFGSVTNIKADNAKGKTTVFDAFCWVLFGKDSRGNSKFHIRPIDGDGKDINFLEIAVSLVLQVDEKEITLKKTQKQKWVKKRGSEEQTFEGNINEFEWNGFPKSEADYNESISSIITDTIFMMVTNPAYFPSMKWKDQREALLKLAGDIHDADIIAVNPKFKELESLLEINTLDAWKEKYAKAIKEYNKQIDGLPGRIDEVSRNIKEVDYSAEEFRLVALKKELQDIEDKIEDASKANDDIAKQQQEYYQLTSSIQDLEYKAKSEYDTGLQKLKTEKDSLDSVFNRLFLKDTSLKSDITNIHTQIENVTKDLENSRVHFQEVDGEILPEHASNCPTCGQVLPESHIEQIKTDFQEKKRNRLQTIRDNGHAFRDRIHELSQSEEKLIQEQKEVIEKKTVLVGQINAVALKIKEYPAFDKHNIPGYIELRVKAEKLKESLSGDTASVINQELKQRRKDTILQIDEINKVLHGRDAIEEAKNRVKELTDQQIELAQKVADSERIMVLIEEFTRVKMNILSQAVNLKFQLVNWKLFDMQINGGMKETCELTVDGVPYSDLNNAAKVQAGLDIINTISTIYEASAPIFIDNREGINKIPNVDTQIINLIVLPKEIPSDTEVIL